MASVSAQMQGEGIGTLRGNPFEQKLLISETSCSEFPTSTAQMLQL